MDATIATLCCNGVISSQSLGIGGGFLMTVYHRKSGKATSIIARETAPAAATEDMFHGNAKLSSEVRILDSVTCPSDISPLTIYLLTFKAFALLRQMPFYICLLLALGTLAFPTLAL